MTESATAKPKFTRRRVVLGVAGVTLVSAIAGVVFGVCGGNSKEVSATFLRFERLLGKNEFLAVFYVTNSTATDFVLPYLDTDGAVLGRFHPLAGSSNSEDWLGRKAIDRPFETSDLKAYSARQARVLLPNDGRTGRVEVCLATTALMPTGPLGRLREWWRSNVPLRQRGHQAICEQTIQCPLVLSDGTVKPPRLPEGREKKR